MISDRLIGASQADTGRLRHPSEGNAGPSAPSVSIDQLRQIPGHSSLDSFEAQYLSEVKQSTDGFLQDRGIEVSELTLSESDYNHSEPLQEGVSGARKILISGKEHVLKRPVLTTAFRKNLVEQNKRGVEISHKNVSESDSPVTDFPRKERLGYLIAEKLEIPVPKTALATLKFDQSSGDGYSEIVSVQEWLPKEGYVNMLKADPAAFEIDIASAAKAVIFNILTENIDSHSGNVMLEKLEHTDSEDSDAEDDFPPDYKAVQIDFGLIFPREESIYPNLANQVKRGLFATFEQRALDISAIDLDNLISPEIESLVTESEQKNLQQNIDALQRARDHLVDAGEKVTPAALLSTFIEKRISG